MWEQQKSHGNLRNPWENFENYETHIISCEDHENHIIPCENHENHENRLFVIG